MIQKIEYFISIGRFRNYQATGDVSFKKLTLFYGDNGSGKTTLTSILRSLTLNKAEIIRRRLSTNHTSNQSAKIIERNAGNDIHHTFNASGWTIPLPEIEIFDIHFVNDNIYSGFDFNEEHKKQLHQFVIGAAGVTIQKQIEANKIAKTASRQLQTQIEQQLIQQVGHNLRSDLIPNFLNINETQSNNIDHHITRAESALANANAKSIIQTIPPLSKVSTVISNIDFDSLQTDLLTTSQSIQDKSLKTLFDIHCQDLNDNSIEGPENWLKTGFSYLESKQTHTFDNSLIPTCPFCQQGIQSGLEIINAYTQKFDETFNLLVQRIQTYLTALQSFDLETIIHDVNNINLINSRSIASWSSHLPNTVHSPTFDIISNEEVLRTEFQNLILLVQQKLQNPSLAINIEPITAFQNSLMKINIKIDTYNNNVISYNQGAITFRARIQTTAETQTEVDKLKRIKKRFEASISTLCTQLISEKQNLRNLESTYTQLSQQQQTDATTFFTHYKNRINHYLKEVFKTPFEIEDVTHVPPQGRATQSKIGYKLTLDGQDISFDSNQINNAKDCLSEGDKSTIALAFFLSKLDIDPDIANKILVFDDPLSSFDSNRRMHTVQIIKDLFPKIKQTIILSHNENFLYEVSKCFKAGDKKYLRITSDFITKESSIEPLDLETLVELKYFKHIKQLEAFLHHPDLNNKENVLGWLRNVLESHIRFKFYRQLSGLSPNDQTFGV